MVIGEKLRNKQIEGIGDKRVVNQTGEVQKLGAGGWGGGVNLAKSDENIQRRNQKMLKKFLKQQKKKLKKQDKNEEAQTEIENETENKQIA